MNKNYIITYHGKCYAIDLDVLQKVCLISDNQKAKETEIYERYEKGDNGDFDIVSKETKEMKGSGNPQNDMIIYDIVKLLISALLSNNTIALDEDEEEIEIPMDFATALAFNTCIKCGILVEVNNM